MPRSRLGPSSGASLQIPSSLSWLFCGVGGVRGAGEICGAGGVGRVACVLGDAGGVGSPLESATALRTAGRAAERRDARVAVPCFATYFAVNPPQFLLAQDRCVAAVRARHAARGQRLLSCMHVAHQGSSVRWKMTVGGLCKFSPNRPEKSRDWRDLFRGSEPARVGHP